MKQLIADYLALTTKFLNKAMSKADKMDGRTIEVRELRKDLFETEDNLNKVRRAVEMTEEEQNERNN